MSEPKERTKFYELKIHKAMKNFKKRKFYTQYFESSEKAIDFLFSQLTKEQTIGYGGSSSVAGIGIIDRLRNEGYKLLDRSNPNNTPEQKAKIERECFSSDVFLASSNAVSEEGHIVNIDLYGNRVSAMIYGPKKVYLIIGRNKLRLNLDDAIDRARNYASPMNAIRFNKNTPCTNDGECHDCRVDDRICGAITIIEWCAVKDRICLLFVNEDLGF